MERELIATGIGGQGIQIATRCLARAAASSGLHVMLFGVFGGSVRGGRSETTLVVSPDPIEAPPIIASTWSALAMHDAFFAPVSARVRPGGLVVYNTSVFASAVGEDARAIGVPMTAMAEELGDPALVGMVALGAYTAASGMVEVDAVIEAMREEIPSYRAQRIPANAGAIARGAEAVGARV